MLKYFDQNFDKHDFREDFIKFVLTSEINEETISIHFVQNREYSARIHDSRVYFWVNQSVIRR